MNVPLNDGLVALIDDADADLVFRYKWTLHTTSSGGRYARSTVGRFKLHRLLMGLDGPSIDHINGNGLDNRRCNLRFATAMQNAANARPRKDKKHSKYKGVHLLVTGRWEARIGNGSKTTKCLGVFSTEKEAALAYDVAAMVRWGEFAKTNFGGART